jgi:hypothetical protein
LSRSSSASGTSESPPAYTSPRPSEEASGKTSTQAAFEEFFKVFFLGYWFHCQHQRLQDAYREQQERQPSISTDNAVRKDTSSSSTQTDAPAPPPSTTTTSTWTAANLSEIEQAEQTKQAADQADAQAEEQADTQAVEQQIQWQAEDASTTPVRIICDYSSVFETPDRPEKLERLAGFLKQAEQIEQADQTRQADKRAGKRAGKQAGKQAGKTRQTDKTEQKNRPDNAVKKLEAAATATRMPERSTETSRSRLNPALDRTVGRQQGLRFEKPWATFVCFFCEEKGHKKSRCPHMRRLIDAGEIHLDWKHRICLGPPRNGAAPVWKPQGVSMMQAVEQQIRRGTRTTSARLEVVKTYQFGDLDACADSQEPAAQSGRTDRWEKPKRLLLRQSGPVTSSVIACRRLREFLIKEALRQQAEGQTDEYADKIIEHMNKQDR